MNIKITKSHISGIVSVNPSKSYEQRILAACVLSNNRCLIKNIGNSKDVNSAREIAKSFGFEYKIVTDNKLQLFPNKKNISNTLNCNESAFNARLFTPIACALKDHFEITGHGSLLKRSIIDDFGILQLMGCVYKSTDGYLPVTFSKTGFSSGVYTIDGSKTSQFISGLLMAFPIQDGDTKILINHPVSTNYLFMTIDVMKKAGISIYYGYNSLSKISLFIPGKQKYNKGIYEIEGDWSSASNLLVAGAISGKIGIRGLQKLSIQPDKGILNVFNLAGVKYYWDNEVLFVEKSAINGFYFDATNSPDLIPILTILALFAKGKSTIVGTSRLLNKESARHIVLQDELKKIGCQIILSDDTIIVEKQEKIKSGKLSSNNDHRIAMAFAVLGLALPEGITIEDSKSITKSYPNFYEDLTSLGASLKYED